MKPRYGYLILTFVLASMILSDQPSFAQGTLKAGMARIDITPSLPVQLYGYASRKTLESGG